MTDYKPGQIAKVTVRGVPDVTVMRTENDDWRSATRAGEFGSIVHDNEYVTDVRPLVVLDLTHWRPEFVARVSAWLRDKAHDAPSESFVHHIADQIAAQTRPAIEEPKGLGAVVEVDGGVRFVRDPFGVWRSEDESWGWTHLNAVRVLSEGVES